MIIGCDVSNWQGKISEKTWKMNKGDIPYCFLRSSYTTQSGFNLYEDKSFDHNIKTAIDAGMKIGIYHYSQATSEAEAIKEAKFCIKTIRKYKSHITLPVAFDCEFGGRFNSYVAKKMGKQRVKQMCDAFCRTIRDAGYEPMVYANLSTLNAYIASDIYKYWNIWVAQYHTKCQYKHPYYAWQFTSSGRMKGIDGRIDLNRIYGKEVKPHKKQKYKGELPKLPHRGWFSSGDKGAEVRKLQAFLNFYGDYGLMLDGEAGRKTIEAVRQYQGREKLKVDGAFGKQCLDRAKVVEI